MSWDAAWHSPQTRLTIETMRDAIRNRSIFNLIHENTLLKVDFMVRRDTLYPRTEFTRRREYRIGEGVVFLVSKEDLIISKIDWARESRSEAQLRDVKGSMETGFDRGYVDY